MFAIEPIKMAVLSTLDHLTDCISNWQE